MDFSISEDHRAIREGVSGIVMPNQPASAIAR